MEFGDVLFLQSHFSVTAAEFYLYLNKDLSFDFSCLCAL